MNNKGLKDQTFTCGSCSEEFAFKGYSFSHRFCSSRCAGDAKAKAKRIEVEQLFLQGELTARQHIYQILVDRDGNECSVCKITEWNGKAIRFWVDHIDGDASNNAPSNFRLICPNCDSQSETFGARNKGNGRKSRGLPQYG